MSKHLPADCLGKIFTYLDEDSNTLHSCILVNTQWCESAVVILWSQPFRFLHAFRDKKTCLPWTERAASLLGIYMSCLQDQETCSRQPYKLPIFNYIQFLKCLDISEFSEAVFGYLQTGQGKLINQPTFFHAKLHSFNMNVFGQTVVKPQLVGCKRIMTSTSISGCDTIVAYLLNTNILGKLLMNNSVIIRTLRVTNQRSCVIEPHLWLHTLLPNTNHRLSQLTSLICKTPCHAQLFYTLSRFANHLQTIKIWMDIPPAIVNPKNLLKHGIESLNAQVEGISTLIRSQQELKEFELGYTELGLSEIISALITQINTLRNITFFKVNFKDWKPLFRLIELANLEELLLNSCYYLSTCVVSLSTGIDDMTDINDFESRIEKLEISSAPCGVIETILLMQAISQYCQNLTLAKIYVDANSLPYLHTLLFSCSTIQTLTIFGPRHPEINVNNVLQKFSLVNLNYLENLSIHSCWTYTPESLDLFLSNPTLKLKKLEILWSRCFGNEHLDVVLKRLCFRGSEMRRENRESIIRGADRQRVRGNLIFKRNNGLELLHIQTQQILKYERTRKIKKVIKDFKVANW
ncbi:9196_t:CDS:2 [Scutellospora calospora]|uniref:9196_t:CDS:1 n=1 Tax=Scutellospora calospora TaxID=85575 RepID=A0ACA9K6F1_9GLOM|nr:9196_t:CDS:2 [Scutellospora calospora]